MGAPFGRCRAFLIADTASGAVRAVSNPGAERGSGAGLSAANLMIGEKVDVVISGNFGDRAPRALYEAGIATYCVTSGSVDEFVRRLRDGTCRKARSE